MTTVSATDVTFTYSRRLANDAPFRLTCSEFRAEPGRITCLVGANGSGKTTFLRLLTGECLNEQGKITFVHDGAVVSDPAGRRRLTARIDSALADMLVPDLLVVDHLALALHLSGHAVPAVPRLLQAESVRAALESLVPLGIDLTQYFSQRVSALSAGQRQGLAISCAAIQRAKVVLADESTAHLDAVNARLFFTAVGLEAKRNGGPAIVVTHDLLLAAEYADVAFGVRRGTVGFIDLPPIGQLTERIAMLKKFIGGEP